MNQFEGRRYRRGEGWTSGSYAEVEPPQETGDYLGHEGTKYSRMKWGLALLTTAGFFLQFASNWVNYVLELIARVGA